MRTLSQKKNAYNIRRLVTSMVIGLAVGYVIRWVRGVDIAPFLCSAACGAASIMRIRTEKA